MKVLLITQHFYPDLVSTGLLMTELAVRWKERFPDLDITVFTADSSREEFEKRKIAFETYRNVTLHRVENRGKQHGSLFKRLQYNLAFSLKAWLFLLRRLNRYEAVVITTDPPLLIPILSFIPRFRSTKLILICYDIYPQILEKLNLVSSKSWVYKLWIRLNNRVYRRADKIISLGRDMSKVILDQTGSAETAKIEVIHNWSDKQKVYPIRRSENQFLQEPVYRNKKVLLYSGTMGTTHDIESILEASTKLHHEEELLFLFVGGGAKSSLVKDHIESTGATNVIWLPFQSLEKRREILSAAAVSFVSLDPAFTGLSVPSKTYSLLAAGIPVFCMMDHHSEIAATILEYECGVVWNHKDSRPMAELLSEFVRDEEKLQIMSKNAYSAFINHFDLNLQVDKYHHLIQSLLQQDQ